MTLESGLLDRLQGQLLQLDRSGVEETTREALSLGVTAQEIISLGLTPAMEAVGRRYEEGEFFIPELLLSARAMQASLEILGPALAEGGGGSPGTVVLGTVEGDVHEIGKNIVAVVLEGHGFEVHNLGEDVPARAFLDKAREVEADVIGMSALISLAVSKMAETVTLLEENGFGGKLIVGGAAVTPETAASIGADAHAADAWQALRRIRDLAKRGAVSKTEDLRS